MDLNEKIRRVPDFPKKGIEFYDITTVLQDAEAFRETVDGMAEAIRQVPCDVIVGLESRGFLFAAPVAYALGKSLVLVRKQGKLPYKRYRPVMIWNTEAIALKSMRTPFRRGRMWLL